MTRKTRTVLRQEELAAEVAALVDRESEIGALRAERDRLRKALESCAQGVDEAGQPCWCALPSMIPYRGHEAGCVAARAALAAGGGK